MFLEIKNIKFILSLAAIFYANITMLNAQQPKDIPIYVSKPIYLKPEEVGDKKIDKDKIKKQYRLFENSSDFRTYKNINLIDPILQRNNLKSDIQIKNNKNIAGQYIFSFNQQEVSQILESHNFHTSYDNEHIIVKPKLIDKFRVILDENERVYFTDGSLIVKFNDLVNFSEFASLNDLMLKKEYIDLNIGIYEHKDFSSLENKIDSLKRISSISDVQYNIINPYIVPE